MHGNALPRLCRGRLCGHRVVMVCMTGSMEETAARDLCGHVMPCNCLPCVTCAWDVHAACSLLVNITHTCAVGMPLHAAPFHLRGYCLRHWRALPRADTVCIGAPHDMLQSVNQTLANVVSCHHGRTKTVLFAAWLRCLAACLAVHFALVLCSMHVRCHVSCVSHHTHLSSLMYTVVQQCDCEHGQSLCPVLAHSTRHRAPVIGARGRRHDGGVPGVGVAMAAAAGTGGSDHVAACGVLEEAASPSRQS